MKLRRLRKGAAVFVFSIWRWYDYGNRVYETAHSA